MMNGKVFGAYSAQMVKRLKKSGLVGEQLALAISSIKGVNPKNTLKMPRVTLKRLLDECQQSRKAVVVVGGGNVLKIFGFEKYLALCQAPKDHKPWEKMKRATKAEVPAQ